MFRKIGAHKAAGKPVLVIIDGVTVSAEQGEPVAAVLLRTPPFTSRRSPVGGALRAPYCMMGVCFDCLAEIDGETSVRSCLARVRGGMTIRRQLTGPDPMADWRA